MPCKRVDTGKPGALLYLDNCAACHRPDGLGYQRLPSTLPEIRVVMALEAISLATIVLEGSLTPRTKATFLRNSRCLPLAWRLSDQEVVDVINFIRSSWGNRSTPIAAESVAKLRKSIRSNLKRVDAKVGMSRRWDVQDRYYSCPKFLA